MTAIPNIGKVALSALNHINIYSLEDLAQLDKQSLSKLHGVGPKAIGIIEKAFNEEKMNFAKAVELPFKVDFAIQGDLGCNNATKREIIRDFILADAMLNNDALKELLSDDFIIEWIDNPSIKDQTSMIEDKEKKDNNISCLNIENILSHGKGGAANGWIYLKNGHKKYFADFYSFASHKKDAKINQLTRSIISFEK